MKALVLFALLLFALCQPLNSQTRKTTPVTAQPEKVEISHYMQEMGLMYVGILEKDADLSPGAQLQSHSGDNLDIIESEIKINITTKADAAYLDLLKLARSTETDLLMAKLDEASRRNYERVCVAHDGQAPLYEQGSAQCNNPKPDAAQYARSQWYAPCVSEARRVYETGQLTGITCTAEAVYAPAPTGAAKN